MCVRDGYRKAAEQRYATAQCNLGLAHMNGRGMAKNEAEATKWYRKAAEHGYAPAQFTLGLARMNVRGVAKYAVAAAEWFLSPVSN